MIGNENQPESFEDAVNIVHNFAKQEILKIMIKCFFNLNSDVCIPILHGGYAVELYNAEYKTKDIDIKIIPKNNTPIEQIISNFKYFVNHHITYASYIRGLNEIDSLNGMRINPLLHQLHEKLGKYFASQIKSIDIIHKKIKEFIIFKIAVQYYPCNIDEIPSMIHLFDLTFWDNYDDNDVLWKDLHQIDDNFYIYNLKYLLKEKEDLLNLGIPYKNANWKSQIKAINKIDSDLVHKT